MKTTANRAVILMACWLAAGGTLRASSVWVEIGDAGDFTNPQVTVGDGNLTEIDGDIKPLGGTIEDDAFLFHYGGATGSLTMTFAFSDSTLLPAPLGLYDSQSNFIAGNDRSGIVTVNDLAAGLYIVNVHSDQGLDPPYTITFNGPAIGPTGVSFAVPEPSAAALVALGLIWLAMFARRLQTVRRSGHVAVARTAR